MFNIVEKNQKVVKWIMIVIIITFALWGIGGYLSNVGDDGYVAKVGSFRIYPRDIDNAILQNPQNTDKMQVMFGLINRQLLLNNIDDYHMQATKTQLQQKIAAMPEFQDSNGQFDLSKYQDFLREKLISAQEFERNIGQQLLLTEFLDLFNNSYFSSQLFQKKFAKLLSRERSITSYTINPSQFYNKINPTEKQINDYYAQNISKFTVPEKVKLQYIVIDALTMASKVKISDAELKQYIDSHKAKVTINEQVDASHILFSVPSNADSKTRAEVKSRAEQVLSQVRQNPNSFAKLAKQYSQDPGSAGKGGELGTFGHGVMVKPFETAVFNLKPGQISNLVETQYGYHIIKLNSIVGNNPDNVKKLAMSQLQKQKSQALLQKTADQLNDLTYNNPASLDPAAKKLELPIRSSNGWVDKGVLSGDFANPKIQKAIFSQDVMVKHNNSELVDIGDGSYAVYRVTDHATSRVQPLTEVKPDIIKQIKTASAREMASLEAQKQLNNLQHGITSGMSFTNPENVTMLGQTDDITPAAVKQIFSASLKKLPAYTSSVDANGAVIIYKITGEHVDSKLDEQNEQVTQQLLNSDAMLAFGAYLGALRSKYDVSYKIDRLNLQSK
ncbi:MAG: peptidyl-prolyl cis-trans isomerase [Pseudomonadota bacterium]|nr:peptidyl-prolyl cis-trans isomerase [Pseudomonadota bacterium]